MTPHQFQYIPIVWALTLIFLSWYLYKKWYIALYSWAVLLIVTDSIRFAMTEFTWYHFWGDYMTTALVACNAGYFFIRNLIRRHREKKAFTEAYRKKLEVFDKIAPQPVKDLFVATVTFHDKAIEATPRSLKGMAIRFKIKHVESIIDNTIKSHENELNDKV